MRPVLEFAAVFAIIIVLSGFSIRTVQMYAAKTQASEAAHLLTATRSEMVAFRAQTGRWPNSIDYLGNISLAQEERLGRYVDRIEYAEGGAITVLFISDQIDTVDDLRDATLTFQPAVHPDNPSSPVSWRCGNATLAAPLISSGVDRTTVDVAYLPHTCRPRKPND